MSKYLDNVLARCRGNFTVFDAFTKADSVINDPKYKNIMCAVSGGADSDVMLDLIHKVDIDEKVNYVWCNTGLEYQATKNHLDYLEDKYKIKIARERAIKPIPLCCKEFGQPFLSKRVSDMLSRLQQHGFKFEDKSFDQLKEEYPDCELALKWWCNMCNDTSKDLKFHRFNIEYNKWLKEFLIAYPPTFKVSSKCCVYSKKKVVAKYSKLHNIDLSVNGVRRNEGGIRANIYSNCYSQYADKEDQYRPLFWFSMEDRRWYEQTFGVHHSKCYTEYGLYRTGCIGCPFSGKNLTYELQVTKEHEPLIYKAVNTVFKDSYEYTKQYREFCSKMNDQKKGIGRLF